MPSPFPGMDPYIESWIWGDFHARLVTTICDRLNPTLPERYIASTELFVWRLDHTEEEQLVLGGPDVRIIDREPSSVGSAVATTTAPYTTILAGTVRKQRYLKIVDPEGRRIVAVIEVLSPANKTGGDNGKAYQMKRAEYIASGISLVEIDLLRGGQRPALGVPAPPIADYYGGWETERLGIWPICVREPLPSVPIPLDPDVPDAVFDLRACIDHVYDCGRYGKQLDYSKPPTPPLREPDATWARELLASRLNPKPPA